MCTSFKSCISVIKWFIKGGLQARLDLLGRVAGISGGGNLMCSRLQRHGILSKMSICNLSVGHVSYVAIPYIFRSCVSRQEHVNYEATWLLDVDFLVVKRVIVYCKKSIGAVHILVMKNKSVITQP